jgi:hypothetical protein
VSTSGLADGVSRDRNQPSGEASLLKLYRAWSRIDTAFVASGRPGTAGESIYTLVFTFSDFGVRFSVTPPPASQTDTGAGLGVQF